MYSTFNIYTLQDIKRLDLSRRKISTLDPFVFSKMHELEELDLSGNRVSGFPINLGLRKLRILNCNKNAFKSVLTLEQFPNLEELHIEDNELGVRKFVDTRIFDGGIGHDNHLAVTYSDLPSSMNFPYLVWKIV